MQSKMTIFTSCAQNTLYLNLYADRLSEFIHETTENESINLLRLCNLLFIKRLPIDYCFIPIEGVKGHATFVSNELFFIKHQWLIVYNPVLKTEFELAFLFIYVFNSLF